MNISPEYLANLSQDLVDSYTNMETELMKKIAEYIAKNKSLLQQYELSGNAFDVMQWQARKLVELGDLNKDAIAIIAKYSKMTKAEVRRIFKQALETGLKSDESILSLAAEKGFLKKTAIPLADNIAKALITAESTTMTTFNAMNNSLLRSTGTSYTKIINDVSAQVLAGTKTVDQAVSSSVKAFADTGLTGFTARNGAEWSPEAYSRMVLQSNIKNTVNQAQEQRYAEYGNNYIEIDAYSGARPKCGQDQGYVYSLDGSLEPITDLNGNMIEVRDWNSSSYGEPDGILGINCGHSRYAFVPGLSAQGAENSDINQAESSQEYKDSQQQRYYERNIRNAKREKAMLEKSGASKSEISKAQAKISTWQARNREFVKSTNGTRYYNREQIYVG